jgi:hypothetical protein
MATPQKKRIGQRPIQKHTDNIEILHDAWQMTKPFVHFGIKAMRVIAHAAIFIVKNIPKPDDHRPKSKGDKVIKI